MTLTDIILKILLFFGIFYGAIMISAYLGKKIREKSNVNEELKEEDKKD